MALFFVPALVAVDTLAISPIVFLGGFVLLLGIFWSTYQTQVPLFLSGSHVWNAIDTLLPSQPLRCIDIGSGLGGAVLGLAKRRADCEMTGVEIAPLPWLISVIRARWSGSAAIFLRRDYRKIDLAHFDVVFAYLSPAAMPALWRQATQQMGCNAMLISYAFGLEDVPPDCVCQPEGGGSTLFVWYPHRFSST